ncbi:MAG: hypothetical protein AB7G93_15790 [Bdellovibrionales bacterium]
MDRIELPFATLDLFPTRWPAPHAVPKYNETFQFWHTIWEQTFAELKNQRKLYSDDFFRMDEILALSSAGKVVGCFLFGWYDLRIDSHRYHSYFSAYPEELMHMLQSSTSGIVMSMGYLAVAPEWRKSKVGVLVSEALLGLACKRFIASGASHLIAYTRNDRKINDLCYRYGARCAYSNRREHNVSVDIVLMERPDVRFSQDKNVRTFVDELWLRRAYHVSTPVHQESAA